MRFPKRFTWGVAAAACQVEGAAHEDGRGESVWDMFCRKPGAIWNGFSCEVACDHYHRYKEDVALMKTLGVNAYRLSISWSRVLPQGTGAVNAKGIGFYDKLVDELLAAKITPYITLFHWDFPYELYCRGGWLNRDSADWFADYTRVIVERLSDRVNHWFTLNEPQCYIGIGHQEGWHAPGDKLPLREVLRAGHHTLLAHGKAVQVIRASSKRAAIIGYAPVGHVKVPATTQPADIQATRELMFSITDTSCWNNTWWMDPIFFGRYPEDGLKLFGDAAPKASESDMKTICEPLDIFGANIYQGRQVRAGKDGRPHEVPFREGHPLTAFRWNVVPSCLYWGPRFYYERYKLPIVITENGMSNVDWVSIDGKVYDPQRIDYLKRHLRELYRAIQDGVDIRGYFQWSLMDNFEWAESYKERFGLVYVDYTTQKRTPKDSFYWYQKVIKTNGASLKVNRLL